MLFYKTKGKTYKTISFALFMTAILLCLALLLGLGYMAIKVASNHTKVTSDPSSSLINSFESTAESEPSDTYNENNSSLVTVGTATLDANFRRVLLVNASNPLPETYDSDIKNSLVTIDKQYRNNNNVTDIHKDVYPYITAMVAAANAEGVNLKIWSPYRSYNTQKILFNNRVAKENGDEAKAAEVVAKPGTSEHNTGLCADFNMANDSFESTPMFTWLTENAENYGFILRYPKDKTDVTGIIYESWHWRFVGINTAKEMNKLGLTLEEYISLKNIDFSQELN